MWTAYRVATTGILAQTHMLEVTAHNLANAQTPAFTAQRAHLVDLPPGPSTFSLPTVSTGIELVSERVGLGVSWEAPLTLFTPGPAIATGRPLDIAIEGSGFLTVLLADGRIAYTRDGSFYLNADRLLVNGSGLPLVPPITVPPGVAALTVQPDGTVSGELGQQHLVLGQILLARFPNPDSLTPLGRGLYVESPGSGPAITGAPGSPGLGALRQAFLEGSNVDVGDELVRTLQAQRAYQVNVRALRMVDEMVQEANALTGS